MSELYVVCLPGLENALSDELRRLGLRVGSKHFGGVDAHGSFVTANVWSRIATRVLLRLGTAAKPEHLARIDLSRVRKPNQPVGVQSEGAGVFAEAARKYFAPVDDSSAVVVSLRVSHGQCTVSVDTSGQPLHMRGFRQETGKAPLRETLASGLLSLAEWSPSMPLWDVMCGSGTIVIEAAEQQMGLAPGRARSFAFEAFAPLEASERQAKPTSPAALILGSDINAGALGVTRRNAKRSGVFERLTLERIDATRLKTQTSPGLVVANLPYGVRISEVQELAGLYRSVGKAAKQSLGGWRFAFLLQEGAEYLELPIQRRFELQNGGLSCELVVGEIEA